MNIIKEDIRYFGILVVVFVVGFIVKKMMEKGYQKVY